MFETIPVNIPILKTNLREHNHIKDKVLDIIDNLECDGYETISKTSYNLDGDYGYEWSEHLNPYLSNVIISMIKFLGYDQGQVSNIWFQQYENQSQHGWHMHLSNYVGVYYLEFPKDSPQTEFIRPISNEKFSIDINEGDVIIFPSPLIHRSPPINDGLKKTIVSFNIDLTEGS